MNVFQTTTLDLSFSYICALLLAIVWGHPLEVLPLTFIYAFALRVISNIYTKHTRAWRY